MNAKYIYKNVKTGLMIAPSEVAGQRPLKIVSVSAAYQISEDDELVLVDCTAAAVTVTLPKPSQNTGKVFRIKKIDNSANAVTISPFTTATIDGAVSATLADQYSIANLISDGTNWHVGNVTESVITGATTITSASATALSVGPNGTTNPVFEVAANQGSQAAGLRITGNSSGFGVILGVISSATNEKMRLTAKAAESIYLQYATATPAGGSLAAGIHLGSSNFGIYFGSGAPSLSATKGSLYIRSDGSSGSTRLYVNTDGAGTWTNVTTAA